MAFRSTLMTHGNWNEQTVLAQALVRAYAMAFWGGTWKELLAVRDAGGQVVRQFGTFDELGNVFPETVEILARAGLSELDAGWPEALWTLADAGSLRMPDGTRIVPYWTLEGAERELLLFVSPTANGGFGGEILVIDDDGAIVGFTAYACARGDEGRAVAHKRFPVELLHVPADHPSPSRLSVLGLLEDRFPGDRSFGIFLDHAVSEAHRGNGLGSRLFDERLDRLVELGADVIFGRTMVTAPRQYAGNYLARGLTPVAGDGTDAFSRQKHYFAAEVSDLRPRAKK